jgi:hypothetical protein
MKAKFFVRLAAGSALGLAAPEAWAKSTGLFGPIAKGIAAVALVSSLGVGGYLALSAGRQEARYAKTGSTHAMSPSPPTVWLVPGPLPVVSKVAVAHPAEPAPEIESPVATEAHEAPARRGSAMRTAIESPARLPNRDPRVTKPLGTQTSPAATSESAPPAIHAASGAPSVAPDSIPDRPDDTSTPRPSTLSDETRRLVEADQALRSGNPTRALALLETHASTYPDSALAPERSAERILALCTLGRVDAASLRTYLAAHPTLLSDRIRETCAGILEKTH